MTFIITIGGSPAPKSRSGAVLQFVEQQAAAAGISAYSLVLRDLPAEELLYGNAAALQEPIQQVISADGIAIATPVYKAAYTGFLKTFLDLLPANVLAEKVIFPIVLGGSPAHSLVLDYALKPVLTAMGANRILKGIYLIDSQLQLEPEFQFTQAEVAARFQTELDTFIQMLTR